ncbi:MAG: hypothetical protein QGG42_02775 [Phycisphaerae bacterium]|nr:hypothetical protein [Phycisphaerae bacterium]
MREYRTHWMQLIVAGLVVAAVWMCLPGCRKRPSEDVAEIPEMKVTVSKATTYFTGPLNKNGTVNYVAAYNNLNGKGVTRDNNAAVLLLRAIGPEGMRNGKNYPKADAIEKRTLELLEMNEWSEKGNYFVDVNDYVSKVFPDDPDSDEAVAFEERFFKSYDKLTGSLVPAGSRDHPEYAKWLEMNRGPLALVTAASKRSRYFVPAVSRSDPPRLFDSVLGELDPTIRCRKLTMALVSRAMLKAGDGDIVGALADLLTVHRLARLLGEDLVMVHLLSAIGVDKSAYDGDLALIAGGKLSGSQAREYLKQLRQLKALPEFADVINVDERVHKIECLIMSGRIGLPIFEEDGKTQMPVNVDWDLLLTTYNQLLDECVKALRQPTLVEARTGLEKIRKQITDEGLIDVEAVKLNMNNPDETKAAVEHSLRHFQKTVDRFGVENVGKLSRAFAQEEAYPKQHIERALELWYRIRARADLTRISLAMIAYKADKAQYPETLAALRPKYLKAAPKDRFTGKPLKYTRKGDGYVLYSVGKNLKDDSGDDEDRNDIVIRIDR